MSSLSKYMITEDEIIEKESSKSEPNLNITCYGDQKYLSSNIDVLYRLIGLNKELAKDIATIWEMANDANCRVDYNNTMLSTNDSNLHHEFVIRDIRSENTYVMRYSSYGVATYDAYTLSLYTPRTTYDYTDIETIRVFIMLFSCAVMRSYDLNITDMYKKHLNALKPFIQILDELVERFGDR